jgi:peptidoglycan/xylan/chitin deacetylase (PgdA/CDA1 family)
MNLKLFYLIKPFLPRSIQLYLRRKAFKSKYKKYKNVWPILPGSEKKPGNWPGWPDGKQFALVLTHDVEHIGGYNKVIELVALVKKYGFVSSFYFVPERDYKVDEELLKQIIKNGFEYGVHGLKHDGKLFHSEKIFLERAKQINNYLKNWKAVGFRAPAMHHNLEMIGELNIKYDLSTFDIDPFQPQPDGVGTIFPFWVNGRTGRPGYLEIPYTLDQDFTLFVLMKESSPAIWIKKLDWIVENGGMALFIVHPDYLNFNNLSSHKEYPVKYFEDFLKYIKNKYEGQYWNALPREIAEYYSDKVHGIVKK